MSRLLRVLIAIAIIISINLPITSPAAAGPALTAPTWEPMTWPLCGRIKEELDDAWDDVNTNCDYTTRIDTQGKTDFPIHHGFGYRNFNDTSSPISFHRGLDFATPGNTHLPQNDNPVFAAAGGYVKSILPADLADPNHSNYDPDYRDFKITLLHPANGAQTCSQNNPCRLSVYNHVSALQVVVDEQVNKGDHIAWSGTSSAGNFDQLHFEIREPYVRATAAGVNTSGKASYAKDARNPMFYLPYAPLTGVDPLTVEITKTPDIGGTDVWVNLKADAGYNFNLKSITLTTCDDPDDPVALASRISTNQTILPECYSAQASYPGTYVAAYEVNNNKFVIDDWSMQHTPFPANTLKWKAKEVHENPYFVGTNPTGPDFFLEKNAGSSIPDGHRYAKFDYKLITATPHSGTDDDSNWYELNVGFTGIEPASPGEQRCYEAEVVTYHPQNGDQVKTVASCFP